MRETDKATNIANEDLCDVGACAHPRCARGMCEAHYARWRRDGDKFDRGPIGLSRRGTPEERFFAKVDKQPAPGCWLWTGPMNQFGYGQFVVNGVDVTVHRFSYELAHEKIPTGYDVDHMCWVRSCVNPVHLRLATRKQNAENPAGLRSCNTSGVQGVHWDAGAGKWVARVGHNGRRYSAGRFTRIEDAEAAVLAKRLELFTHNNLDREVDPTKGGNK